MLDILTAKGFVKYYGKGESLVKAADYTSFSVGTWTMQSNMGRKECQPA